MATKRTMFSAATQFKPASQSTENILYLVTGNKFYVSSKPSFFNAPSYIILNATQMQPDNMGHCTYTKS